MENQIFYLKKHSILRQMVQAERFFSYSINREELKKKRVTLFIAPGSLEFLILFV